MKTLVGAALMTLLALGCGGAEGKATSDTEGSGGTGLDVGGSGGAGGSSAVTNGGSTGGGGSNTSSSGADGAVTSDPTSGATTSPTVGTVGGGGGSDAGGSGGEGGEPPEESSVGGTTSTTSASTTGATATSTTGGAVPDLCAPPESDTYRVFCVDRSIDELCEGAFEECEDCQPCLDYYKAFPEGECRIELTEDAPVSRSYVLQFPPTGCSSTGLRLTVGSSAENLCTRVTAPFEGWELASDIDGNHVVVHDEAPGCVVVGKKGTVDGEALYGVDVSINAGSDEEFDVWIHTETVQTGLGGSCPLTCDP